MSFAKFAACIALTATPLVADPVDRSDSWNSGSIPWQAAAPNGTRYALLEGHRDQKDRPFSYAFFIPGGVWDSPHAHSATARVFVVRGALRLGYGDRADRALAKVYPAGSYLVVPADAVHFDGAEEDTVIIGTAIGLWQTTYRDGSQPASAGTPLPHPTP